MKDYFWNFVSVFWLLFIFTFEFQYTLIPEIYLWINPFFEQLILLSSKYIFGLGADLNPEISSDSIGLFIHVFNIFWISFAMSSLLKVILKKSSVNLRLFVLKTLTYYLSLQLLIYGLDKVFKAQFFYPEPNTLYTPLKDLSKDILYWSAMGMSRGYSIFLGTAEIVVAVLLWFRKTRLIATIIGVGIMINVVAVNFGFDISVKVYSLFLLLSFFLILSPYFKYLVSVFFLKKEIIKPIINNAIFKYIPFQKRSLKILVISLFLAEGLFPYIQSGNFNDDTYPRPKYHGAYSVGENEFGIKRLFIHRHGYLIFQNEQDEFQDFKMEIDIPNNKIEVNDYRTSKTNYFNFESDNNKLTLITMKKFIDHKQISLTLKID